MKIKEVSFYLDGGTVVIRTDKGSFCVDSRLHTKTKGKLFYGYPRYDNTNIIDNPETIKNELIECINLYDEDEHLMDSMKEHIIKLISDNN